MWEHLATVDQDRIICVVGLATLLVSLFWRPILFLLILRHGVKHISAAVAEHKIAVNEDEWAQAKREALHRLQLQHLHEIHRADSRHISPERN